MRRRAAVMCLVAVLVTTGCGGTERSAHPRTSGTPARSTDSAQPAQAGQPDDLTYAEIMERCLPQLQRDWKHAFLLRPTAANLVLRNPRLPHRAGDLIGIGTRGLQQTRSETGGGAYCVIPRPGHEQDPVPATRFRPDPSDTRQIGELCTEADGENGASGGYLHGSGDIANLSLHPDDVTVLATASLGHRVIVLYGGGNITSAGLTCLLDGTDDELDAVAPAERIGYADESSGGDSPQVVYYGAGLITPRARTIEITPPGGHVYRVRVRQVSVATGDIPSTPFGAYAFFLTLDYPRSYYGTFPVRVLDAAGKVLSTSQWDSAAMDRLG